jgi:Domain of unknown function (DUF6916)
MTDPDEQDFHRLAQLRRENFESHLGQEFSCDMVAEAFVLMRIIDLDREDGVDRERPPFALHFRHPQLLAQRTYPLHHKGFGQLPIFLVPIGSTDDGFAYEAVFQ